jgi:phosphomannomutase
VSNGGIIISDQIVSTEEEINLLLEMAAESSRAKGCLSDLITSPLFKEYELDEKDVKVVAILFRNLLEGKDEARGIEVLKKIGNGSRVDFADSYTGKSATVR